MTRPRPSRTGALLRPLGGLVLLGSVLAWVGTGPLRAAWAALGPGTLAAAVALGAVATLASAWRWRLLAAGLGLTLRWSTAVTGYYHAQLLNGVLPAGVLGDVHRAARHGRDSGALRRAATAVLLDRVAGQLVLLPPGVLLAADLLGADAPMLLVLLVLLILLILLIGRLAGPLPAVRGAAVRALRAVCAPAVLAASLVALGCYLATFLMAARAAGVTAPVATLLAPALVALVGMSVPVNVGGWGPREVAAGWAFAVAGLGTTAGVTASVVYGVLVLAQAAPGALTLLAGGAASAGRWPGAGLRRTGRAGLVPGGHG